MALWVNAYGKFFWPVQVGGVPPLTEGGGGWTAVASNLTLNKNTKPQSETNDSPLAWNKNHPALAIWNLHLAT